MFVESFQGLYKDGTNNTRDFRVVSASFLILRISILVLFLNHICSSLHLFTFTSELQGVLFVGATCIHAITRPYKLNFINNVDIAILFCLRY